MYLREIHNPTDMQIAAVIMAVLTGWVMASGVGVMAEISRKLKK